MCLIKCFCRFRWSICVLLILLIPSTEPLSSVSELGRAARLGEGGLMPPCQIRVSLVLVMSILYFSTPFVYWARQDFRYHFLPKYNSCNSQRGQSLYWDVRTWENCNLQKHKTFKVKCSHDINIVIYATCLKHSIVAQGLSALVAPELGLPSLHASPLF